MTYDAFEAELGRHYEAAVRYCGALSRRHGASDADDLLQDSLTKALENFASLRDDSRFKTWLFTIITRTFYSSVRRGNLRARRFLSLERAASTAAPAIDAPDRYEARELLERALAQLSSRERAAVLLHEVAGLSIREVAAVQKDVSISATKSRISRARSRMRDHLRKIDVPSERHPAEQERTDDEYGSQSLRTDAFYGAGGSDLERCLRGTT